MSPHTHTHTHTKKSKTHVGRPNLVAKVSPAVALMRRSAKRSLFLCAAASTGKEHRVLTHTHGQQILQLGAGACECARVCVRERMRPILGEGGDEWLH